MKLKPDITLGPNDTAPVYQQTLRWSNNADGTPGPVVNLSNATVFARIQDRGRLMPWVDLVATPVGTQAADDPDEGVVELDFRLLTEPLTPGNYDYRYIGTLSDGRQVSIPDGVLPGTMTEFFWLHVAADFTVVA